MHIELVWICFSVLCPCWRETPLVRNHLEFHWCQVQSRGTVPHVTRLSDCQGLGRENGDTTCWSSPGASLSPIETLQPLRKWMLGWPVWMQLECRWQVGSAWMCWHNLNLFHNNFLWCMCLHRSEQLHALCWKCWNVHHKVLGRHFQGYFK